MAAIYAFKIYHKKLCRGQHQHGPGHPGPRHPVENWRTFWWTWDSRVAGPWRDLISRVSLASAKYLIYTAPAQFVHYHQAAEKSLHNQHL